MEESFENVSQQSNFMDLTVSPEITRNNFEKLDRPPRYFGQVDNLRSIQELPTKYRCIFEYPFFNIIQSNVLDDVLYSDVSVVISAPTGSGKTTVFELAIIRLLMKFEETNYTGDYKIVYVAPVKSLCHERLSEWHIKFSKIGISCIVLTGDSDNIDIRILQNKEIIITTPEKWDSVTRNAKETNILDFVKLFMIDEVHLLNEETRGPNLEVMVSRMKILKNKEKVRFLAVSATIPNIEDIAQWLGHDKEPAVYFKIGEELRPVKLNKVVIGYPCASETANFKFDLTLNYKLQNVLMEYADGKPTLIFCSTRKGVELTSSHLSQNLTFHLPSSQLSILSSASSTMFSTLHKTFLSNGIGCHHAGMSLENRSTVETLFREGHLPVLVATSTLAMGVNLPAHLVVVKGTKQYVGGSFQECSESSLLQMIGRAGRPQFDTSATVVIMTTLQEKKRYEKMLGGTELIESNLHRHLTEHLNAEVVLGTITDIAIALEWLRYTFLYIRVLKNPKHYNIPMNYTKNQIEKKLQERNASSKRHRQHFYLMSVLSNILELFYMFADWCQIEINALNKYGMLQIDQVDGFSVSPTNMGALMANYYLTFPTMKLFSEIKGNESLSELLMLLSKCNEFSVTYLRVNDKKSLNTLNKCKYQETIRFPLKGTIKTTPMKIYCIIQATFGCIKIQNPALCQEAIKIMRIGERIAKCIVTYLLHKDKCFHALLNALILNQCFIAKIWENSPYVSIQFPKIGNVLSSMLVSAGKTSFKTILETPPRDIERIINRAPPMGNELVEAVMHLPYYKINLEPSECDKFKIKVTVTLLNSDEINVKCTAGLNSHMVLLVGDTDNNILLCKKLYHHTIATCKEQSHYINVLLRTDHVIHVYLISENWVGIDCKDNYDIIINQDKISTKTTTNFTNKSNPDLSAGQKSITSYFKTNKNGGTTKQTKKPKPKNNKATLDTYFSKQNINKTVTNINQNNTPTNITKNTSDSGFISNETNENVTNSSTTNYTNQNLFYPTQYSNIFSQETQFENAEEPQENFELQTNFHVENIYELNNNSPDLDYNTNTDNFKLPQIEVFKKPDPKFEENKKLSLKNNFGSRQHLTHQKDFKSFSQNLASKFSQDIENNSMSFNSQPLIVSNNYSNSLNKINPVDQTKSIAKRLENNIKMKSILNEFKYTPQKRLSHTGVEKIIKNKKSQNVDTNYSQISLPDSSTNNTEKVQLSQTKNSVTNEELEKFKRFMENKLFKSKSISSTVTSKSNNELNISNTQNTFENFEGEIDPVELCEIIYEDEMSQDNSLIAQNNDEIILSDSINESKNKIGTEKPYFPNSFREYVQNSIDKLKNSTLVNEYFNYDIGFEEFLMRPLDAASDSESSEEEEAENNNFSLEKPKNYSFNNSFISTDFENNFCLEKPENYSFSNSFVSTGITDFENVDNMENITFSCTGQIINKNENGPKLNHSFESFDQSISFSPENNFQPSQTELQNSEEFCELKIENKLQIIEQYYNSPIYTTKNEPEIVPIKRQKLSAPPLFPISKNKKYFKDPKKDTFKNLDPLKKIMSTYGNQYDNKITLPQNTEMEILNDPVVNEFVERSYSINQREESVEMTVTIYEKKEQMTNNKTSFSKPFFRS